jgi:hypothetical protein
MDTDLEFRYMFATRATPYFLFGVSPYGKYKIKTFSFKFSQPGGTVSANFQLINRISEMRGAGLFN